MKKIAILSLSLSFVLFNVFLSSKAYSQSTQNFTTNGTFITPAGITSVTVQAWGGGGSGSNITSNGRRGGGGGGGAFASNVITVSADPSTTYPIVVGTGGTNNTNGGASMFNTNSVVAAG